MSGDAKLDALRWEVLQCAAPSAKLYIDLASATRQSASVTDAASRAVAVTVVYERAVRALPYSYKLWTHYAAFKASDTRALCSPNEWFQAVRGVHERAVASLPRMPLLWVTYLEFVCAFPVLRATMMRHLTGRALATLPATQHHLVWRVVKRWTAQAAIPRATFRALWSLHLLFDTSTAAKRQYFSLLQRRGDTAEYVRECARLAAAVAALRNPRPADTHLFEDTAFWEPLLLAFQSPGWFMDGAGAADATTLATLTALVAFGRRYCASSLSLELAYIGFLHGQGYIVEGRVALWAMLTEAADPDTFSQVFRLAAELEDQVVESFSLSDAARELMQGDEEGYLRAVTAVFGCGDPSANLTRLVGEYPLLLNQAQLRCQPRCVPLWLKRAELLQESIYASRATEADLLSLYQQAIAQCTAGLETVDAAAAQLHHCYAVRLCAAGRSREAAEQLHRAAMHVRFSSAAANAALLGLSAEVRLLSGAAPPSLAASLLAALTAGGSGAAASSSTGISSGAGATPAGGRRRRGALLASLGSSVADGAPAGATAEAPTSLLCDDVRPWLLAADLAGRDAAQSAEVAQLYGASNAFTAEGAVCIAFGLWWRLADAAGATREFERVLTRFQGDALATLYVVQQYASFLCVIATATADPAAFPLHRFRELSRAAEEAAPAALRQAPAAALDVLLCFAFIERSRGLYGNAVRIVQQAATAALERLDSARHFVVLASVIEKAVRCTQQFKGCPGTRPLCAALLQRTGDPALLQRIALHWAAIERRCGNYEHAFTVFNACGDSQDPATPHGEVFWRLWGSLCANIGDYEKMVRRKQQVEVRFQKRRPAAGEEAAE